MKIGSGYRKTCHVSLRFPREQVDTWIIGSSNKPLQISYIGRIWRFLGNIVLPFYAWHFRNESSWFSWLA